MNHEPKSPSPIITIGSGNIEHVLELDGEIHLGRKHIVKSHEFLGGSCINYSIRLMSMGEIVYPIPFIGKDKYGREIQKKLISIGNKYDRSSTCENFINSEDFFVPTIQTPKATIMVHKGQRTIFSQGLTQTGVSVEHIEKRIRRLIEKMPTCSIMIGHVTPDIDAMAPGEITKKIIDICDDSQLIYANLGNGQLVHGVDFWKKDMCRTDIFQLNIEEIKRFFLKSGMDNSLYNIIKWLRKNSITAVITLNRFGAVGTYKDGRDGIVLAWPLDIGDIIDPTGAGDAFASGMVSCLKGKKSFSFNEFVSAIDIGRYWASYACKSLGACAACPDKKAIDAFIQKQARCHDNLIMEITEENHPKQIMDLIDNVYQLSIC
ncbi:MAG: carbohydrate kinase family protein [Proteobacteria bacterium]|nr:carbohydrate kinase family protein [Pseudomonadota bacterium]